MSSELQAFDWTPTPETLDERTMRAIREPMTITHLAPDLFEVHRPSGSCYRVDLEEPACTCPDFACRNIECKHIRRVRLAANETLQSMVESGLEAQLDDYHDQIDQLQAVLRNLELAIEEYEELMESLAQIESIGD